MKLLKAILVLCFFNVASAHEFCNSPEVGFNGLVHPLVEQIKNWNIERMIKGFDQEDLDFYMEVKLLANI